MSIEKLDSILAQFKDETKGVEYVGLYSRDAFLLNQVGQWDDESFVVDLHIKLSELYKLVKVGWSESQQIWIAGKDGGYLISVFCHEENLLLVKADHQSVIGQLKIKLEKTLEQLQAELTTSSVLKITHPQTSSFKEIVNGVSTTADGGNSSINYRGRSL